MGTSEDGLCFAPPGVFIDRHITITPSSPVIPIRAHVTLSGASFLRAERLEPEMMIGIGSLIWDGNWTGPLVTERVVGEGILDKGRVLMMRCWGRNRFGATLEVFITFPAAHCDLSFDYPHQSIGYFPALDTPAEITPIHSNWCSRTRPHLPFPVPRLDFPRLGYLQPSSPELPVRAPIDSSFFEVDDLIESRSWVSRWLLVLSCCF